MFNLKTSFFCVCLGERCYCSLFFFSLWGLDYACLEVFELTVSKSVSVRLG